MNNDDRALHWFPQLHSAVSLLKAMRMVIHSISVFSFTTLRL